MKVCVARHQHRYGTDLRVFDCEERALEWRTELAKRWWANEFPLEAPPSDAQIGQRYFEKVSERCSAGDEDFSYDTVDLERSDDSPTTLSLTLPTVHLNGTSAEALLMQLQTAGEALQRAISALAEVAPHRRDYYPQGAFAFRRAYAEHRARLEALERVYRELAQIVGAIDQPTAA